MRLALLIAALLALAATQADAIRVQFPPGASSTTIKGTFFSGAKVRYTVHARSGQRMKITLTAAGADYRFLVFAPDSNEPLNGSGLAFEWNGVLAVTGDYLIQVFTDSPDRSLPFQLQIALTTSTVVAESKPATEDNTFSPDGYYVFSGKAPRGFASFKGFSITTAEAKADGTTVPVPPAGAIDAGGKYKLLKIELHPGTLAFESRSIGGTSFKFEGRFLVSKGYCDDGRTTGPVLSGRLTKLLNGAPVSEAEVKLEWSCSDI